MLVCGTSHPDSTMLPAASKLAAATNRLSFMVFASPRNSIRVDNCSYRNPYANKHQTNWSTLGLPPGCDVEMSIVVAILNYELPVDGQRVTGFGVLRGKVISARRQLRHSLTCPRAGPPVATFRC